MYDDALDIATKKIAPNADKRFKVEHGELFEVFETIDDILDKNKVRSWLLECVDLNSYAKGSVEHFYNLDYSKDGKENLKDKIDKAKNKGKSKKFLYD